MQHRILTYGNLLLKSTYFRHSQKTCGLLKLTCQEMNATRRKRNFIYAKFYELSLKVSSIQKHSLSCKINLRPNDNVVMHLNVEMMLG
jgi:hypothetical protein